MIFLSNQIDLPGTVSRKHNINAGETILIFRKAGSDAAESGNPFMKSKMIAGNPKSIFAKIKNTFGKIKNQNDLSVNRLAGNDLQEAGNKLKNRGNILSEAGNVLKEEYIFVKFPGNKLKD